jgi:hypothetical protein
MRSAGPELPPRILQELEPAVTGAVAARAKLQRPRGAPVHRCTREPLFPALSIAPRPYLGSSALTPRSSTAFTVAPLSLAFSTQADLRGPQPSADARRSEAHSLARLPLPRAVLCGLLHLSTVGPRAALRDLLRYTRSSWPSVERPNAPGPPRPLLRSRGPQPCPIAFAPSCALRPSSLEHRRATSRSPRSSPSHSIQLALCRAP